ncbi:MAG: ABC transporter ATP-binding protein, partial [Novosphingobium sp.]
DFLDRTVTITLGMDGSGKVDIVAGGYADWEKIRKQRLAGKPVAKSSTDKADAAAAAPPPPPAKKGKLSYKDQRDYELLPKRIEELDAAIARGEAQLADPDLYTRDPKKFDALMAALEKVRAEKDTAEERWLELAELAEG